MINKKNGTESAVLLSFTDEPVVLEDQIVYVTAQNFLFFLFLHAFSLLANSLPDQYMRQKTKSCTKRCKREKILRPFPVSFLRASCGTSCAGREYS